MIGVALKNGDVIFNVGPEDPLSPLEVVRYRSLCYRVTQHGTVVHAAFHFDWQDCDCREPEPEDPSLHYADRAPDHRWWSFITDDRVEL